MHEVTQSILHGDPSGRPGDCLRAATASLLELPLDAVPHFVEHDDWLERFADFCAAYGFRPLMRMPDVPVKYGMAWGPSERRVRHAVCWVDGAIAWDPHPSRAGLLRVTELIEFEPLEPHVPEQHTVVITVEASGEVTPAPQPDAVEPTTEEELTDG